MNHPKFPPTFEVEHLAQQILNMAEERDYWRRQALRNEAALAEHTEHVRQELAQHEQNSSNMLTAVLDPDSGINRMVRDGARDLLRGAQA